MHQHFLHSRKKSAALLSAIYFLSNAVFLHARESNFWAERRENLQKTSSNPVLMAGLSVSDAVSPFADFLQQLPALDHRALTPALSTTVAKNLPQGFAENNAELLRALPYAFGSVRKISLPTRNASQKIVIHIQDVHQNQEAQNNIGRAVQTLVDKGQVGLVALEGAFAPINLSGLRAFSRQDVLHKLADYLLRVNKISGPIHAALTGTKPFPAIQGVDDSQHYWANVEAYRRSAPRVQEYRDKLSFLRSDLERRKVAVFNPDLLSFDRQVMSYHDGKTGLEDHLLNLASSAPPDALPPTIRDFLHALEVESTLDFKRVEAERRELVECLVQKLNKKQIDALVQWSAGYRAGQVRYADFYRSLQVLCGKNGLDLRRYPAMDDYIHYVLAADRIDAEQLMADMSALENSAYNRLARSREAKRLMEESRALSLAGKLVDFSLTPDEYRDYRSSDLSALPLPDLPAFEAFYKEAHARDQCMVDNLLKAMDTQKARTAVLVTGGYHSPGMAEKLKKAGVTVISFTPKIEKIDTAQGSAYLSVFTQEKTPLEKMFQGQKLFLADRPVDPGYVAVNLLSGIAEDGATRRAGGDKAATAQQTAKQWRKVAGEAGRDMTKAVEELQRLGLLPAEFKTPKILEIRAEGEDLLVVLEVPMAGETRVIHLETSFAEGEKGGVYLDIQSAMEFVPGGEVIEFCKARASAVSDEMVRRTQELLILGPAIAETAGIYNGLPSKTLFELVGLLNDQHRLSNKGEDLEKALAETLARFMNMIIIRETERWGRTVNLAELITPGYKELVSRIPGYFNTHQIAAVVGHAVANYDWSRPDGKLIPRLGRNMSDAFIEEGREPDFDELSNQFSLAMREKRFEDAARLLEQINAIPDNILNDYNRTNRQLMADRLRKAGANASDRAEPDIPTVDHLLSSLQSLTHSGEGPFWERREAVLNQLKSFSSASSFMEGAVTSYLADPSEITRAKVLLLLDGASDYESAKAQIRSLGERAIPLLAGLLRNGLLGPETKRESVRTVPDLFEEAARLLIEMDTPQARQALMEAVKASEDDLRPLVKSRERERPSLGLALEVLQLGNYLGAVALHTTYDFSGAWPESLPLKYVPEETRGMLGRLIKHIKSFPGSRNKEYLFGMALFLSARLNKYLGPYGFDTDVLKVGDSLRLGFGAIVQRSPHVTQEGESFEVIHVEDGLGVFPLFEGDRMGQNSSFEKDPRVYQIPSQLSREMAALQQAAGRSHRTIQDKLLLLGYEGLNLNDRRAVGDRLYAAVEIHEARHRLNRKLIRRFRENSHVNDYAPHLGKEVLEFIQSCFNPRNPAEKLAMVKLAFEVSEEKAAYLAELGLSERSPALLAELLKQAERAVITQEAHDLAALDIIFALAAGLGLAPAISGHAHKVMGRKVGSTFLRDSAIRQSLEQFAEREFQKSFRGSLYEGNYAGWKPSTAETVLPATLSGTYTAGALWLGFRYALHFLSSLVRLRAPGWPSAWAERRMAADLIRDMEDRRAAFSRFGGTAPDADANPEDVINQLLSLTRSHDPSSEGGRTTLREIWTEWIVAPPLELPLFRRFSKLSLAKMHRANPHRLERLRQARINRGKREVSEEKLLAIHDRWTRLQMHSIQNEMGERRAEAKRSRIELKRGSRIAALFEVFVFLVIAVGIAVDPMMFSLFHDLAWYQYLSSHQLVSLVYGLTSGLGEPLGWVVHSAFHSPVIWVMAGSIFLIRLPIRMAIIKNWVKGVRDQIDVHRRANRRALLQAPVGTSQKPVSPREVAIGEALRAYQTGNQVAAGNIFSSWRAGDGKLGKFSEGVMTDIARRTVEKAASSEKDVGLSTALTQAMAEGVKHAVFFVDSEQALAEGLWPQFSKTVQVFQEGGGHVTLLAPKESETGLRGKIQEAGVHIIYLEKGRVGTPSPAPGFLDMGNGLLQLNVAQLSRTNKDFANLLKSNNYRFFRASVVELVATGLKENDPLRRAVLQAQILTTLLMAMPAKAVDMGLMGYILSAIAA